MSTSCTIAVDDVNYAKVYVHWDGYPSHMMPWLENFNKDFVDHRGFDPQYKFAQLLRSSVFNKDDYGLDPSKYTGWGVVPFNEDQGVSYEYTLHPNGLVTYT